MKKYPIKFNKIFVEKIWGGRDFEKALGMQLPDDKLYGESWELSVLKNGSSTIVNGEYQGKKLFELLEEHKSELVGEKIYARYGNQFPLLIKYLDINDKLSVQVHPNDGYALKHENSFGKAECWYIMSASHDAKLIFGLKEGVTKEEFVSKVSQNEFAGIFNEVRVQKGDFIYVEPGMVHATVQGSILIAEIQQSSDVTYRIYDFDRADAGGNKRALHIKESANVINFNLKNMNEKIQKSLDMKNGKLLDTEYFSVEKCTVEHKKSFKAKESFQILSVLDGKSIVECGNEKVALSVGETMLIPAKIPFEVVGNIAFLNSYIRCE
ncbi:MAG: class I mannose-6-phosphate isomerase [Fusobacteria bacterium]|nr:class I mannose-6-phosphate isomerase [Fusobacteriota bacterium]